MCVRESRGGNEGVTAGHSQESLIWTGSAAAEVGGVGWEVTGSGVEPPKPITGQRRAARVLHVK